MKDVLVLGDIHGRWARASNTYHKASKEMDNIDLLIQVGDFGYWPKYREAWTKRFSHPCWWIDGNHENFDMLNQVDDPDHGFNAFQGSPGWDDMIEQWEYKPRGTIESGILFVGGASSIDKDLRTPGVDWFAAENISSPQQRRILEGIDSYSPERIHTVISHDCPTSFDLTPILNGPEFNDSNRKFLEEVRRIVRPDRWFFGHYHRRLGGETEGTRWRCVGAVCTGDYASFELPDIKGH